MKISSFHWFMSLRKTHLQKCLFAFLSEIVEEKRKSGGMWRKWLYTSIGPPIGFSLRFPIDSINGQNDIDLSTNELSKEVRENEQRNSSKLWWFSCNTANKHCICCVDTLRIVEIIKWLIRTICIFYYLTIYVK